ncbi:MAG: hypothetical protein DDT38_01550 [Firmicutes bacterium]|nr:hypothetical protein [candidate division NPL-UPA2 bacterium]
MMQSKSPVFDSQLTWQGIMLFYMLALIVMGTVWPSAYSISEGLVRILQSPSLLLSDYMVIGGPGAALVNAGLVGLLGLLLVRFSGASLAGGSIAGIFTLAGFALFGKNPLNILPIIVGVYVFSRVKNTPFKTCLGPAMFGTAIAPLVSQMAFGFGLPLYAGLAAGLAAGFIMPALASHLLPTHQGHNLYNIGFTAGILGTLAMALLRTVGHTSVPVMHWSTEHSNAMFVAFLVYCASMVLVGLLLKGTWSGVRQLHMQSGILISDFTALAGFPTTFINMGLMGLVSLLYLRLVGGDVNGPTLGGVLTIVGFAAFGKHLKNSLPVMAGVWIACLILVPEASQPGPQLAALFGTTLAPIAGSFGPLVGLVAGFLHLSMVMHVGVMHGGMNLYNNGLAGGLVATLMIAVIRALQPQHRGR